jgi:hypothetical protein
MAGAAAAEPAAAAAAPASDATHARTASGAIELMPMHASKSDSLPPLMDGATGGGGRRSSGHTRARGASKTKRLDRLHKTAADKAVASDLERFEAFLDGPGSPTGSHFVGVHATPSAAVASLDKVQRDIDKESWRWGGESAAARRRRERRGVSDSLLTPNQSYLMSLNAVRDFEDEVRASGSLPDLPSSDLSWVLAGEMPDEEPDAAEDTEQAKARKAAAKAKARERQARADAIRAKRRQREQAAEEEAARQAARLALSDSLRASAEAVWFEHDSSAYRLARPVGEKLAGSMVTWTQEDEDGFARTADSLKDDWFGACAPGWGFAMWPRTIPKSQMDGILSRLEGGQIDSSAIVESWLASVDVGAAQLNRSFYAVRYKLGIDQNGPPSTAVVDACLALEIPKPPEDEPLRVTVARLAEKAGIPITPTAPSVVPAAIDAALADCGVSALKRFYLSARQDGNPVYVLQTASLPRGATRPERAAAGEEWWLGFLLVVAAIRAAAAAAVAQDEDDFEAQDTLARFNLHEGWSDDAFFRATQRALEREFPTKPDGAMVAEESARLAACLTAEFTQRTVTDALRSSVSGSTISRHSATSSLSAVGTDDDAEVQRVALLEDCTQRLAALGGSKDADKVKILATRAACHLDGKEYEACIDDCSSALAVAEGVSEVVLPRCWSATVLRLRGNAYERLQDYDASHADSTAAFHLSRSDPRSESAEVDYWLFQTETSVRWPTLAAAAQPARPLPTRRPRVPQPQPTGLAKLSLSESDLPKPSKQRGGRNSRASGSGVDLRADGPPSHCSRLGVSAEWLLAWSEANGLTGEAEWYTDCNEGRKVMAYAMEKVTGGCSTKTARRAMTSVLAEEGLVRPVATLCNRVTAWTGAKNKSGAAGDLNAPLPAGPSVADVVKKIVVPATRLAPAPAAFAAGFYEGSEGGGGVGLATHLVVHARAGGWWGLVQACIVHTLGWIEGNEARSMTAPHLRKALRKRAEAAATPGGDALPLYWLDFFAMPQHSDPQTPSPTESGAASGLQAWQEVLSEVKRCVLVVGEGVDMSGPAPGALTAPAPRSLQRSWCCTELLLAAAARADIDLALSFGALHALSERLNFRFGTPRPKVVSGIQSCWADWMPAVVLGDSRCSVDEDTAALRAAVKSAGGGLNIADRKLRKLLTEGGTPAALGLLDYFTIHGGL